MVKRHDNSQYDPIMEEDQDGEYVEYADYEALEAKLAALVETLKPFAVQFEKHSVRYKNINSTWFENMPSTWPITITVTMFHGRAALVQVKGGNDEIA